MERKKIQIRLMKKYINGAIIMTILNKTATEAEVAEVVI